MTGWTSDKLEQAYGLLWDVLQHTSKADAEDAVQRAMDAIEAADDELDFAP